MITMKATRKLALDFDWLGRTPTNSTEDEAGRIAFFIDCMQCDKHANNHMLKCENEQELVKLFHLYNERIDLSRIVDFSMQPGDFEELAKNTWNDPEYQKEKTLRKKP